MILKRMWQDLRRQPRWFLWVMLVSAGGTFTSMLLSGPNRGLGGWVPYVVVLCGAGAVLASSVVLLLLQGRDRRR
ncbi:hypothetical protein ACFY3U_10695 [Micromonospora sp. NPDC000089]|uniref:hypothetical protein n=1 Tax=unclassified Micromonospora TaxID=2617518 RepID=UPI00367F6BCC